MHLLDCHTDDTMIVMCWETEEQAARSGAEGSPVAALSGQFSGTFSVWEVGARA